MVRDVVFLVPTMTIRAALDITRDQAHSSSPLVDIDWVIKGVVRRDALYDLIKNESTGAETTVSHAARSILPTISANTGIRNVVERLIRSGANKLIVVDGD